MAKILRKYKEIPYENKVRFFAELGIISSFVFALAKFWFSFYTRSYIFAISATFNIFIGLAKLEAVVGSYTEVMGPEFLRKNRIISMFLFIASIIYSAYMINLIINEPIARHYGTLILIVIILVTIIELVMSTYGLVKVKRHGHMYRDIKIINLSNALTSIVLSQAVILSVEGTKKANVYNGYTGVVVGIITLVLSIFIFTAPRMSIIDREENNYTYRHAISNVTRRLEKNRIARNVRIDNSNIEIVLYNNKIYGYFTYVAKLENGKILGRITRKRPHVRDLSTKGKIIYWSFCWIFAPLWLIGRAVVYFKNMNLPKRLDKIMAFAGCHRMDEEGIVWLKN